MPQTLSRASRGPHVHRTGPRRRRDAAPIVLVVLLTLMFVLLGCATQDPAAPPTTSPTSSTPPPSPVDPASSPTPSGATNGPTTHPTPAPTSTAPATSGFNTVLAPIEGATVAGPKVVVSGTGTAFEALLEWEVLRAGTTEVVAAGTTEGGSMGDIGPWSFTVDLTPGWYTAQVWTPNMAGEAAAGSKDAAPADQARVDLVAVTFRVHRDPPA